MTNETLVAVPLFILMGVTLDAKIAEQLLASMASAMAVKQADWVFSHYGWCLAATGIVGATVVTMGVLVLPTMLRAGYQPALASGLICATGTLGRSSSFYRFGVVG